MISEVNISTWEQPQKEACRATEGAIVLIMQALVRVVFPCRLRDLVDKTVRYIYLQISKKLCLRGSIANASRRALCMFSCIYIYV